jgi:hypothetical protein
MEAVCFFETGMNIYRLHGVTTQQMVLFIVNTVRTSRLVLKKKMLL